MCSVAKNKLILVKLEVKYNRTWECDVIQNNANVPAFFGIIFIFMFTNRNEKFYFNLFIGTASAAVVNNINIM